MKLQCGETRQKLLFSGSEETVCVIIMEATEGKPNGQKVECATTSYPRGNGTPLKSISRTNSASRVELARIQRLF